MGGNHRVDSGLSRGPPLGHLPSGPTPTLRGPVSRSKVGGGLFWRLCLLSSLRCDPGPTSVLSESMLP